MLAGPGRYRGLGRFTRLPRPISTWAVGSSPTADAALSLDAGRSWTVTYFQLHLVFKQGKKTSIFTKQEEFLETIA
jgi:hypothetical protein